MRPELQKVDMNDSDDSESPLHRIRHSLARRRGGARNDLDDMSELILARAARRAGAAGNLCDQLKSSFSGAKVRQRQPCVN